MVAISYLKKTLAKTLVMLIQGYQWLISPFLGARCRFYPSCSEYAKQAILTHGIIKGTLLAIKRLLRCHPFCAGGFDPVPEPKMIYKE